MTDGAPDGDWRLITEERLPGALAMAFDTVAAETAADGGPRTVRVYRWTPSTLSLGYRQDPSTIAWEYCATNGIDVVRRQTGGGAIYHDHTGDLSYSIIAPAEELPDDLMDSYGILCQPILETFRELGIDAEFADEKQPALHEPACYLRALHPAHDMVGDSGRKIAGNAQYRTRDAIVQHGSLSFRVDADRHLSCFADPGVTPEEFRDRVTGIAEERGEPPTDSLRERAVETLETTLAEWCGAEADSWTERERERAETIAEEKYRTDAWTRNREAPEL
ncbi:MAG: biotin/lipoate A/B protein ligase family protein [Halobacteriales archaeon]|nr:biotin/lipoate A/B protein ligase family protein [Halobacteriales archaeon]